MSRQVQELPKGALEALKVRLEALQRAELGVHAWFETYNQSHWLGGSIEDNAYSVPPAWVQTLGRKDILTSDKLWLIEAALVPDPAFPDFEYACKCIGVTP